MSRRLETSLPSPEPRYAEALGAHLRVLACDPARLGSDDLECLAAAWDRALAEPATRAMVTERAAALGARDGDRALEELTRQITRDIAGLALATRVSIARRETHSPILLQARHWLRGQLIAEIELAFDALQKRAAQKRALASMDEWREFLSLRGLYLRGAALGGMELRHLAFPHVHHTVCKLAVWLWNERREFVMANAMFRWLLDEALLAGDAEAIELQSRNWDPKI